MRNTTLQNITCFWFVFIFHNITWPSSCLTASRNVSQREKLRDFLPSASANPQKMVFSGLYSASEFTVSALQFCKLQAKGSQKGNTQVKLIQFLFSCKSISPYSFHVLYLVSTLKLTCIIFSPIQSLSHHYSTGSSHLHAHYGYSLGRSRFCSLETPAFTSYHFPSATS